MNPSNPDSRAREYRPYRVLFVCMGNICRSPAAEGIFQALVDQSDLSELIEVDSAGTIGYHEGARADARMREAAGRRGYQLTSLARKVKPWDLTEFHWVIAMDRDNLANLKKLDPEPSAELRLLSDYLSDSWPKDVPDPYYGGDAGFEEVLNMLEAACPAILEACRKRIEATR